MTVVDISHLIIDVQYNIIMILIHFNIIIDYFSILGGLIAVIHHGLSFNPSFLSFSLLVTYGKMSNSQKGVRMYIHTEIVRLYLMD